MTKKYVIWNIKKEAYYLREIYLIKNTLKTVHKRMLEYVFFVSPEVWMLKMLLIKKKNCSECTEKF